MRKNQPKSGTIHLLQTAKDSARSIRFPIRSTPSSVRPVSATLFGSARTRTRASAAEHRCIARSGNLWEGSFSAVSKPNFARKYVFESSLFEFFCSVTSTFRNGGARDAPGDDEATRRGSRSRLTLHRPRNKDLDMLCLYFKPLGMRK